MTLRKAVSRKGKKFENQLDAILKQQEGMRMSARADRDSIRRELYRSGQIFNIALANLPHDHKAREYLEAILWFRTCPAPLRRHKRFLRKAERLLVREAQRTEPDNEILSILYGVAEAFFVSDSYTIAVSDENN